jgi:hypothetical protein
LEGEGKIRLQQQNVFPILDYLLFCFREGRLTASGNAPGEARTRTLRPIDWASLEIVGGDHERLSVRRIGSTSGPAFEHIRVRRAQVLQLFPSLDAAQAPIHPQARERAQTKEGEVAGLGEPPAVREASKDYFHSQAFRMAARSARSTRSSHPRRISPSIWNSSITIVTQRKPRLRRSRCRRMRSAPVRARMAEGKALGIAASSVIDEAFGSNGTAPAIYHSPAIASVFVAIATRPFCSGEWRA